MNLFRKHDTSKRIIICPLYDKMRLSKEDVASLVYKFGKSNVYDFSGKNSITEDFSNYYETSHYRPPVAGQIMEQAYQREQRAKSQTMCAQQK